MAAVDSGSGVSLKYPRTSVVGGFTVVRNKLRYREQKVDEILPFWMTSPAKCSDNLEACISFKKVKRMNIELLNNVKQMGVKRLFPIQSAVLPYIVDYYKKEGHPYFGQPRDICISSPTGSGKTLAYALPILQVLSTCIVKVIRAIVVLPVRDLARQVAETFCRLTHNTNLRVVLLTGEESFKNEQEEIFMAKDGNYILPDIVVCTPGRLVDHIYNTPNFCLEHVRFLVVDEADRVIVEEKQDWYNIFEAAVYGAAHLSDKTCKWKRFLPLPTIESQCSVTPFSLQKILLSATLTHDPEPLKRFRLNFPRLFLASFVPMEVNTFGLSQGKSGTTELVKFDRGTLQSEEGTVAQGGTDTRDASGINVFSTPSGLKEFFVELVERQKPLFLAHLIKKLGHQRILCFANSREATRRLAFLMSNFDDIKAEALNAGMPLRKRTRLLSSFASGEFQLLICTDTVSRGIDIEDVSCVVSYEAPQSIKTYVHRVGRTARAGKSGQAFTLLLRNQIRYFKSSLKSVGKHAKNFALHSSMLRSYAATYKRALSQLEGEFRVKPKDAFGGSMKSDDGNLSRWRKVTKTEKDKGRSPRGRRNLDSV